MSDVANPEATEVLGEEPDPCKARPSSRQRRNLDDIGQVMALAAEVAAGDVRRASLVSIAEIRAIATLAIHAGLVAAAACELFGRSDAGADRRETTRLLMQLAMRARPFMGQA